MKLDRGRAFHALDEAQPFDLVVVGGGITGAGILREASLRGLRALLVEQRDFAWGSSSRSSKLVHGGLRYLRTAEFGVTRASVRERLRLLRDGEGLIDPLGFLLAVYARQRPGRLAYGLGLLIYDLLAGKPDHAFLGAEAFLALAPGLRSEGLRGGYRYGEAQTDDARLVLRLIQDALGAGGVALNYLEAVEVLKQDGRAAGVVVRDRETGRTARVRASVVVNAAGAWSDRLRAQMGRPARLRPLRGSHLLFPSWRLRVAQAVGLIHPADRRPVFVVPWEGVTLVGTTDRDHEDPLDQEPAISEPETAYLMAALDAHFGGLGLEPQHASATLAGVRPVVGTGKADPSHESRDHVVWDEDGLVTVTGGKLTTFRLIALDALRAVRRRLPRPGVAEQERPVLSRPGRSLSPVGLDPAARLRLMGRHGDDAGELLAAAGPGELRPVEGSATLWAELRWGARAEAVVHLDDLLLRRTRLGLVLPDGAAAVLPRVRALCQAELGWDDSRWEREEADYLELWRRGYAPPAGRR